MNKPPTTDGDSTQQSAAAEPAGQSGMRRLLDTEASTPLLQTARALLESTPALPESHARMQRVRRELERRELAPVGMFAGLFARARHMPAVAVALLIGLFGASAFAAVRIFEAVRTPAPVSTSSRATRDLAAKVRRAPVLAPLVAPAGAAAPAAPAAQPSSATALATALDQSDGPRLAAPSTTEQPATRSATHPQRASDSELVHRALKALRRDADPALAARLLDEHRARNPAGPLAEEALSLQIEASLALHDGQAGALARKYLSRYPSGRYVRVARQALGERGDHNTRARARTDSQRAAPAESHAP